MRKLVLLFCFLILASSLFAGTKVYYYDYEEGLCTQDALGRVFCYKYEELSGSYSSADYDDVLKHRNATRKKYYNKYGYPTSRDDITIFIGSVAGNANGKSWEYGAMTEIQERDEDE